MNLVISGRAEVNALAHYDWLERVVISDPIFDDVPFHRATASLGPGSSRKSWRRVRPLQMELAADLLGRRTRSIIVSTVGRPVFGQQV